MAYKDLLSLYFGDNHAYLQEYKQRLESEDAIKIDFEIGERQAFYVKNTEVLNLAFDISRLDSNIRELCHLLPIIALRQYSKKCLIDEIVITNKIEGVHSSRSEIGDALDTLERQSEEKGKRKRFRGLVNKYLKLIEDEYVSLQSCEDIRGIYDEIFLDEVVHENPKNKPDGEMFRKGPVIVYSETGKEIHRGVMPESRIVELMEKALDYLNNSEEDGVFKICIFHYLLEYIHPFYDGNGRLGRFILSYGISNELASLVAFRISETIKTDIVKYYKAFTLCNDQRNLGDLTPFLIMLLNMIKNAMSELLISLKERYATWGKYEEFVKRYYDNEGKKRLYSLLVQAALFSENGITMRELEQYMELSNYRIKNMIDSLPQDLLVVRKKGNRKFYLVNLKTLNESMLEESAQLIEK